MVVGGFGALNTRRGFFVGRLSRNSSSLSSASSDGEKASSSDAGVNPRPRFFELADVDCSRGSPSTGAQESRVCTASLIDNGQLAGTGSATSLAERRTGGPAGTSPGAYMVPFRTSEDRKTSGERGKRGKGGKGGKGEREKIERGTYQTRQPCQN